MTKRIQFYAVEQFGRTDFYVNDERFVQALSLLTGRKIRSINNIYSIVLTSDNMEGLRLLGYTFQSVIDPMKKNTK